MSPIKHIRSNIFDVSQSEFAVIARVTQATVSRWESDKLSPSLSEMRLIRDAAATRGLAWDDSLFFNEPIVDSQIHVEAAE